MIIGHQKQRQFLRKSVELEKIPHAFLFSGPGQVGKKTAALEFIKLINCVGGAAEKPCQRCSFCVNIQKNRHPDVLIVAPQAALAARARGSLDKTSSSALRATEDKSAGNPVSAASNAATAGNTASAAPDAAAAGKPEIKISQIRDMQSHLTLKAHSAPLKAVIIDEAHCLNREAQSAFLKLLEEPKGRTLFILVTEYPEQLLPTVLSRVQTLKFSRVADQEILDFLQSQKVQGPEAKEILRFSLGRPGAAINFLREPAKRLNRINAENKIFQLMEADLNSRFKYAKEISGDHRHLMETLNIWLECLRDLLLAAIKNKQIAASGYPAPRIQKNIELIQDVNFLLATTNVNQKLALEILMLEI